MEWAYASYGLSLLADGEIPGLARSAPAPAPDVCVRLNTRPARNRPGARVRWYESERLNAHGRPNLVICRTRPDDAFHFVYDDGIEFLIHPDGGEVWCAWPESATVADAAVYLRGPILGLVLRLRGIVCLHASAIAIDDSAIAILGSAGAGKSTTAAGFVELGFPLLADDVAALHVRGSRFHVAPAYPRLNLWPDAGEALYGSAGALPRIAPADGINTAWDKRYRDLEPDREFHPCALPLAAVYVLDERAAVAAPRIAALSARDAFVTLTDGTHVNYALDESMRATEFRVLGQLVRTVPVRLVTPHDSPARVLDLCHTILSDYRRITSAPPCTPSTTTET